MKQLYVLVVLLIISWSFAQSQTNRYIIQLTDKNGTPHTFSDPSTYLSPRAIARRTIHHISIDSTDLPINPAYLAAIKAIPNVTVINSSKWFNQVLVRTTDAAAVTAINALPFVKQVNYTAPMSKKQSTIKKNIEETFPLPQQTVTTYSVKNTHNIHESFSYGASNGQISIHSGQYLHQRGFTGKKMTMAMLDAGFLNYKTNRAFDSARLQNRILGEWDFVLNEASVNEDHYHGAYCFSVIAANLPGELVGTAPHASFWLFRSEDAASEYPVEEQNWVAAAERADSVGADMISSSLGYSEFDDPAFNHSYAEKDGNTALITRAADLAAAKGILVMNSAGNSGNSSDDTKYIACPADGDSVFTVGSTDVNGNISGFSSWGYNSAGKVKPDAVSVGQTTYYVTAGGNIFYGDGTSFACPNLAGLVACLWEAFPEFNNMTIIDAVQRSSSRFLTPDNRYGYGIPDFRKAFHLLLKKSLTADLSPSNCINKIEWTGKDDSSMNYIIERQVPGSTVFVPIATVLSKANEFKTNSYSFSDTLRSAYSGTITYRLKLNIHSDTSLVLFEKSYENTGPCFAFAELKPGECINKLEWSVKDDSSVAYSIQRKLPKESVFTQIGFVKSSSDELKMSAYSFTDTLKKFVIGNIAYRIVYLQQDTSFILYDGSYMNAGVCSAKTVLNTDNCSNRLEWSAKDDASVTYSIERKLPGMSAFAPLGTVKSSSTELKTNNYSFTDTISTPVKGTITYRILLSVQDDTSFVFSENSYQHTVSCFAKEGYFFTPNPFKNNIVAVLNSTQPGTLNITIHDIAGRIVYRYKGVKPGDFHSVSLPLSQLRTGVYIATMKLGNETVVTQKIIK
jgi:serine protease AprX